MKINEKYPTILKLQQIFKLGYLPSRGNQSYKECRQYAIPNCFAHACFNLTNEQLEKFNKADFGAFRGFIQSIFHANRHITADLFDFVRECGLKVTKSNSRIPSRDNEWKVALYFGRERFTKDYHFLLQEKDGSWSGKIGSEMELNHYPTLPKQVQCNFEYPYTLYGVYKITNPFACKSKRSPKIDNEEKEI
ncbi:MAG: hypothetical protein IJX25_04485 [Clostridia bacterium]|nr:hypothetical protein [Clostridia bacterium]